MLPRSIDRAMVLTGDGVGSGRRAEEGRGSRCWSWSSSMSMMVVLSGALVLTGEGRWAFGDMEKVG
eukprot:COSAG02_NODE_392_length_23227_cov_30.763620_11_plen_66_part_00